MQGCSRKRWIRCRKRACWSCTECASLAGFGWNETKGRAGGFNGPNESRRRHELLDVLARIQRRQGMVQRSAADRQGAGADVEHGEQVLGLLLVALQIDDRDRAALVT